MDPCKYCRFRNECRGGEDMGDFCPFADANTERAKANMKATTKESTNG